MYKERSEIQSVPYLSRQDSGEFGFFSGVRDCVRRLSILTPFLAVLSAGLANCSDKPAPGGVPDTAGAGRDAGDDSVLRNDSRFKDARPAETGAIDSGVPDAGLPDFKPPDSTGSDSKTPDKSTADLKSPDQSAADSGKQDSPVPDKGADGSQDSNPNCPKIVDFSLKVSGNVTSGGVNYTLRLPLANVDAGGTCKIWAESSNSNDPGLLNGSANPITLSPQFVTAGVYACSSVYTSPASDYGHTVTFHTEVTENGCTAVKSVSYQIAKP